MTNKDSGILAIIGIGLIFIGIFILLPAVPIILGFVLFLVALLSPVKK